jgi:acetoin utilization protein AcuB
MPTMISDIMSTRVVTIEMDDRLFMAKEIFEQAYFHHLLVIDEYKLVGILSERDLLRALSPNLGSSAETTRDLDTLQKRAHQVMTRNPVTISAKGSVDDASRLLLEHGIGCLPVLQEDKIIGIVTWKDLLQAYLPQDRA